MGESSEALNVSPMWAVAESTESIMRMETGVPFGTVTCRVTGAGGSGLTSFGSGGAPGASTAGATGAGSVKVGGPAGAGAATAAPSFLATSFRWLSGVGFGLGAGRDAMARGSSAIGRECGARECSTGGVGSALSGASAFAEAAGWSCDVDDADPEHPAATKMRHRKRA